MTTEENLERLKELGVQLDELKTTADAMIQRQKKQLAEMREDTKMTRRLWVRLAAKYGWLDDEDLDGDGT